MTHALPFLTVHADLQFLVLESEPGAASAAVSGWLDAGLVVRVVRGRKMRTRQGLFDEFGAALQFPSYFGENADAFDECLTDLGWLPPQNGYVIVITDPGQVLAEAGPGAFGVLVAQLEFAAGEWSRLIGQGEWWDRPPVPFHVVLQPGVGEAAAVTQQWSNAGATVAPFPS